MGIDDIFGIIDDCLFTVKFDDYEIDEMTRIFRQWNDPERLHQFFEEHLDDLQSGFFGSVSIEEAVEKTREQAKELNQRILQVAHEGQQTGNENLSQLFKPLSMSEERKRDFQKGKAYGINHNSWLRVYAIRINVNVFVICGGSIKLTPTMNDRQHLLQELDKLEITRKFLEEDEDYADYFFELSP